MLTPIRGSICMAQVGPWYGAGVILGVRLAPRNPVLCVPVAQVPLFFPHLRQEWFSPAPGTILAYAKEAHFIQPKLEVHAQVRLCEAIELWISKLVLERCTHLREWGVSTKVCIVNWYSATFREPCVEPTHFSKGSTRPVLTPGFLGWGQLPPCRAHMPDSGAGVTLCQQPSHRVISGHSRRRF